MTSSQLQHKKLDEIGTVRMCKRVLKHQTSIDAKIPFYKISTFGGEADTYISEDLYNEFKKKYSYPKIGDILISAAGTIGKTVIFDGNPSYFQDSNIVWIEHDESVVTNRYLYYFYKTEPWRTTSGSTISRIYNNNLRDITIPTPSLSDQQKIAGVLSALDDKIELNRKINAELEQMARTLYDYWFVQFDFPDAHGKPYKTSGGPLKHSKELNRPIPTDWEVSRLNEVEPTIITGKTPSTKMPEYFNGKIPFICITDIRGNAHVTKTALTLSEVGANTQKNKFLPAGSLCVTCIASPGLVAFSSEDSQTNQQINSIVFKKAYNRHFLYFYLRDYFKYSSVKTGNTFANMNKEDFSSILTIKPSVETLRAFREKTQPIFEKILSNQQQSQNLAHLRDWLLPMLMNGQVSVE